MVWVVIECLASLSLATDSPTDDMLDLFHYSTQQSLITPTVNATLQSPPPLPPSLFPVWHLDGMGGHGMS